MGGVNQYVRYTEVFSLLHLCLGSSLQQSCSLCVKCWGSDKAFVCSLLVFSFGVVVDVLYVVVVVAVVVVVVVAVVVDVLSVVFVGVVSSYLIF